MRSENNGLMVLPKATVIYPAIFATSDDKIGIRLDQVASWQCSETDLQICVGSQYFQLPLKLDSGDPNPDVEKFLALAKLLTVTQPAPLPDAT